MDIFREPKNKMEEAELKIIKQARQEVIDEGIEIDAMLNKVELLPSMRKSLFEDFFLKCMLGTIPAIHEGVHWSVIWINAFGSSTIRVKIVEDYLVNGEEKIIAITPPLKPLGVFDFNETGKNSTPNIVRNLIDSSGRSKVSAEISFQERLEQLEEHTKDPEVQEKIRAHKNEWGEFLKKFVTTDSIKTTIEGASPLPTTEEDGGGCGCSGDGGDEDEDDCADLLEL